MSSLPEEIYLEILARVPVKSAFMCKCVCKSWFSLISDPDFVEKHLNLCIQKKNNCSVMFRTNNKAYSLSFNHDSSSESDADIVELETPYKYLTNRSTQLLGSCNGLVYGWLRPSKVFFLWNAATKEFKRLPKSEEEYGYSGFGYDYKTDDYKLVNFPGNKESSLVHVYSLKSNSWKSFQFTQSEFHSIQRSGVLFNGCLHWFDGTIGNESSIVVMDISEERFQKLQPPITLPTQHYMNMGVLEECLCVLVRGSKETFEVWIIQDYGVTDSWTKLYTIKFGSIMCGFGFVELIGSFNNGEILFNIDRHIIFFDLMYGTTRKLEVDDTPYGGGVVKYFESLVSLNSITAVGGRENREVS